MRWPWRQAEATADVVVVDDEVSKNPARGTYWKFREHDFFVHSFAGSFVWKDKYSMLLASMNCYPSNQMNQSMNYKEKNMFTMFNSFIFCRIFTFFDILVFNAAHFALLTPNDASKHNTSKSLVRQSSLHDTKNGWTHAPPPSARNRRWVLWSTRHTRLLWIAYR